MTQGPRYRKLPGYRRGLLRGASVWIADDHLLAVRSYRVREEYKRFHLRDVQAIVVAQAPRFHISTRALLIAAIWLWAYSFGRPFLPASYPATMWTLAAVLVCVWLYISFAHSCRCRILTAVSSDELPSVYRSWTARRFLAQVEPRIAAVQGRLEGNWMDSVEARTVGPSAVPGAGPETPVSAPPKPAARNRTIWSMLFVALLFVSAVAMLITLDSPVTLVLWLASGLVLAEIGVMIGVFVQHYRGILRPGMQRLAIATVVKIGIVYYTAVLIMSAASAKAPGLDRTALITLPAYLILRQVDAWAELALGLVGAVLLLGAE